MEAEAQMDVSTVDEVPSVEVVGVAVLNGLISGCTQFPSEKLLVSIRLHLPVLSSALTLIKCAPFARPVVLRAVWIVTLSPDVTTCKGVPLPGAGSAVSKKYSTAIIWGCAIADALSMYIVLPSKTPHLFAAAART